MEDVIVIDTNVILSALKSRNGKSFELISKLGTGVFDCAISVPLILEYEAILKKHLDRTIFTDNDIEAFIDYICSIGIKTRIFYLWRPFLKDPYDDHVLELAINSNSKIIITYNKKDFIQAESLGISILTPKEYLMQIEEAV